MDNILPYLWAFLVGGVLCVIAQILIDRTKLTPARILVIYVVAGVILGAVGVYGPLVKFAGAGASKKPMHATCVPKILRRDKLTLSG